MEQFSEEYSKLSHLSKDFEYLIKQTKPKLVESLMIALTILQLGWISWFLYENKNKMILS